MLSKQILDLTGKQYGKLTVINFHSLINKRAWWLCKCECGNEKIIRSSHLVHGSVTSCKCKVKLPKGEAGLRGVLRTYKHKASQRGYSFDLTDEQFKNITKMSCHYCGSFPNNEAKHPGYNGNYVYNGIDRIDNTKGYSIENCVPCCRTCNRAKNTMSYSEYINWIHRTSNYLKDKNL